MTDMASGLRPLAGVALVGTGRSDKPVMALETEALAHIGETLAADPNRALLAVAGTLALQTRVARDPERLARVVTPGLQLEELAAPSVAASRLLAAMLDGRHSDLLSEYLLLLRQTRQRVPEVYLPTLLERGAKLFHLRPYILPVIGEAGRWLATQNEAWRYASPAAASWAGMLAEWRSSTMTARQGILYQTRLAAPETGLALLESSWKAEGIAATVWMTRSLATGLSMKDEPFLERALDDRNATVRLKAAELLACLPASRLCQRMTRNSSGVLRYQPRSGRFDVHFPKTLSTELVRDGVINRNWKDPMRVRSAQLSDMLGAVPLDVWTKRWNLSPREVVTAAGASKWHAALLKGFALAALRQENAAFSEALLELDKAGINSIKLIPLLKADAQLRLIKQFEAEALSKTSPAVKLYSRWLKPWSQALVALWLARLEHYAAAEPRLEKADLMLRNATKQCARLCPLDSTQRVKSQLQTLLKSYPDWHLVTREAESILSFRGRMYESLAVKELAAKSEDAGI